MKFINKLILATMFFCLIFLSTADLFAQQETGWGLDGAYGQMYDPKTVETISGEVLAVNTKMGTSGLAKNAVLLTVKTEKGSFPVFVGPAWYINDQGFDINKNDKLEITGSMVTDQGKAGYVAAIITKGDQTLKLRGVNTGSRAWKGQGQRRL